MPVRCGGWAGGGHHQSVGPRAAQGRGRAGASAGWGLAEGTRVLAERAGVPELAASSLKAALDLDWDDEAALPRALGVVLAAVGGWRGWPPSSAAAMTHGSPRVGGGPAGPRPGHRGRCRRGGADPSGCNPRPTDLDPGFPDAPRPQDQSQRIGGYKRHLLTDLDTDLIPAVGVTAANLAEAAV